jgi:hypothetical protein
MPDTVWTILVAAATAVVTTTATGLLVIPRLEARKKRLVEVHAARDAFGVHMLRIISACSLLPPALLLAATAVVTALAKGLFVTPRMEARKKRLGGVHATRDTFSANMTRIISACGLLQQVQLPADDEPGWTPVMRERLAGERERWWQQIDDATRGLIDNVVAYAGSWPTAYLIQFAVDYASNARMVALSEREEATKLELLLALTVPVQRQFFGWSWARARHAPADRRTFAATVARISGEPATPVTTAA